MARQRVAVQEAEVVRSETRAEPDGLWAIALLRVAVELKRPDAPGLPEIIDGVVARMGIPRAEFEQYIEENVAPLKELAARRGYAR